MKICVNTDCKVEIDDNAKFCPYCGTKQPVEIICPSCKTKFANPVKFCTNCGFKIDGTSGTPQKGGLSIGSNNAISAKNIISGNRIEAKNYTINNIMAAEKSVYEKQMDKLKVTKLSKEYVREELAKAKEYEKNKDYQHAYEIYKELSDDGNFDAKCSILDIGYKGYIQIKLDERLQLIEEMKSYMKSGHPDAMFYCGVFDFLSNGSQSGFENIKTAAINGSKYAMEFLNDHYMFDDDGYLKRNITEEAFKWIEFSANRGDPEGMYYYARCFDKGMYGIVDKLKAVKWYRKSAEQGYAAAQYYMGCCYDFGDGVAKDMKEAAKWYRLAAENGDTDAQYSIGCLYFDGDGVPQDDKEAFKWFRMAAAKGYASAQYELGYCYYNGYGVEANYEEALNWLLLAAKQDDGKAYYLLGEYYFALVNNYEEALKWFILASNKGVKKSDVMLGHFYFEGLGVKKDYNEAFKHYMIAADDYSQPAFMVGECYRYGYGVDKSLNDAIYWYQKAADKGNKDAIQALKELQ